MRGGEKAGKRKSRKEVEEKTTQKKHLSTIMQKKAKVSSGFFFLRSLEKGTEKKKHPKL
jgi:hypothetical protein